MHLILCQILIFLFHGLFLPASVFLLNQFLEILRCALHTKECTVDQNVSVVPVSAVAAGQRQMTLVIPFVLLEQQNFASLSERLWLFMIF